MKTSKIPSFDYLVNASDILIPVSDVISISLVENRLNFISRAACCTPSLLIRMKQRKLRLTPMPATSKVTCLKRLSTGVITALPDLSSSTASACSRTQSGLS
jgi:hypothetical protein